MAPRTEQKHHALVPRRRHGWPTQVVGATVRGTRKPTSAARSARSPQRSCMWVCTTPMGAAKRAAGATARPRAHSSSGSPRRRQGRCVRGLVIVCFVEEEVWLVARCLCVGCEWGCCLLWRLASVGLPTLEGSAAPSRSIEGHVGTLPMGRYKGSPGCQRAEEGGQAMHWSPLQPTASLCAQSPSSGKRGRPAGLEAPGSTRTTSRCARGAARTRAQRHGSHWSLACLCWCCVPPLCTASVWAQCATANPAGCTCEPAQAKSHQSAVEGPSMSSHDCICLRRKDYTERARSRWQPPRWAAAAPTVEGVVPGRLGSRRALRARSLRANRHLLATVCMAATQSSSTFTQQQDGVVTGQTCPQHHWWSPTNKYFYFSVVYGTSSHEMYGISSHEMYKCQQSRR